MKKITDRLYISILFFLSGFIFTIKTAPEFLGRTFFHPRAQNTNIARDMVTLHPISNYKNFTYHSHIFTSSIAYNQSVRPLRIARALFGTNTMTITGSNVDGRDETDLLADYFGLSQTFQSNVRFKPQIKSITITPGYFYNACQVQNGLYINIQVPISYTNWDLHISEIIINEAINNPFPAGYMSQNETTPTVFSFTNALKNKNSAFGSVQKRLFGNVDGRQSKITLAEIRTELGYYVYTGCKDSIAIQLLFSIPTGNKPKALNFFEPLVGNGKHVEFGIGARAQTVVWEMDPDQAFTMHSAINLTHLCKKKQTRSFDLQKNGFFSRYTLLKEFDEVKNPTGKSVPAINVTTLSCDVRINIQADICIMGMYRYHHCLFAFGYNGWIASKENISLRESIAENRYGLKGIQNIFTVGTNMFESKTESNATIFGNLFINQNALADATPLFISNNDIDIKSAARPLQLTHKIFFNIAHHWDSNVYCNTIEPFISFGGEIEFEGINEHNTARPDKTTMGQWGVWLTAGFGY